MKRQSIKNILLAWILCSVTTCLRSMDNFQPLAKETVLHIAQQFYPTEGSILPYQFDYIDITNYKDLRALMCTNKYINNSLKDWYICVPRLLVSDYINLEDYFFRKEKSFYIMPEKKAYSFLWHKIFNRMGPYKKNLADKNEHYCKREIMHYHMHFCDVFSFEISFNIAGQKKISSDTVFLKLEVTYEHKINESQYEEILKNSSEDTKKDVFYFRNEIIQYLDKKIIHKIVFSDYLIQSLAAALISKEYAENFLLNFFSQYSFDVFYEKVMGTILKKTKVGIAEKHICDAFRVRDECLNKFFNNLMQEQHDVSKLQQITSDIEREYELLLNACTTKKKQKTLINKVKNTEVYGNICNQAGEKIYSKYSEKIEHDPDLLNELISEYMRLVRFEINLINFPVSIYGCEQQCTDLPVDLLLMFQKKVNYRMEDKADVNSVSIISKKNIAHYINIMSYYDSYARMIRISGMVFYGALACFIVVMFYKMNDNSQYVDGILFA